MGHNSCKPEAHPGRQQARRLYSWSMDRHRWHGIAVAMHLHRPMRHAKARKAPTCFPACKLTGGRQQCKVVRAFKSRGTMHCLSLSSITFQNFLNEDLSSRSQVSDTSQLSHETQSCYLACNRTAL